MLVVACSDGRLQMATDEFLSGHLGIEHYDRLYVPGGAGALSPSGRDYLRAHEIQQECLYLVNVHSVDWLIAILHGPSADGPPEAMCADYLRKFEWADMAELREQQERDARELLDYRWQWAGRARVDIFRCEVGHHGDLAFVTLHADPEDSHASHDTQDSKPHSARRLTKR